MNRIRFLRLTGFLYVMGGIYFGIHHDQWLEIACFYSAISTQIEIIAEGTKQ